MLRASQSRSGAGSKRRRQCTQQEMAERRNRLHFVREQRQSRTRVGMFSYSTVGFVWKLELEENKMQALEKEKKIDSTKSSTR